MASDVMKSVTPSSALNKSLNSGSHQTDGAFHCNSGYLMNTLGLFLQFLLAILAFTSLILKRYCEPRYERRPWKIWFYDTSKQAFGAAVIHFANVFLADAFQGDPCTWYVVSFILDSTIGLFVIYIGLKLTQVFVRRNKMETLYFGEYGSPPKCSSWVGQCGLYILVMIIEKMLMTGLIQFDFWADVRRIIMSPVKDPNVELVIVMFIVPLVVNAFIFWVVDNFLKRRTKDTKTIYVSDSDHSVRYSRGEDTARLYNRIDRTEDGDSDIILTDEDGELRQRHSSDNDVAELLIT
ncbi:store-operated calcium entry regulator STIMATE-like [Mercenaria mercenaria]|uniref:store-operated calcium entry regulator STIMATE-like n=1 Tax=Mercenaria mercenaria TaxID=6596 RepID=UPI001E1D3727|nr:store-operated calcium entry regulator STIMATE-like [Mercenaria mercenaria]